MRFMIDKDIVGMGWVKLQKGKFDIIPQVDKLSFCQIELSINEEFVEPCKLEGEF